MPYCKYQPIVCIGFPAGDYSTKKSYGDGQGGGEDADSIAASRSHQLNLPSCFQAIATVGIPEMITGPCYIWKNVAFLGSKRPNEPEEAAFHKCAHRLPLFVYHNTMLTNEEDMYPAIPFGILPSGNGDVSNYHGKNNILDCSRMSIDENPMILQECEFDYNLYTSPPPGAAGSHAVEGTPVYEKDGPYNYFLRDCPGIDQGVQIPNFNDNYQGESPDMGVLETGGDPMPYGPQT
ncbi:MAG: hypothetical protein GY847_14890 [Proteobacteria bacterium]|nr:hypothetical protein [Pseudomonadota bacterium]